MCIIKSLLLLSNQQQLHLGYLTTCNPLFWKQFWSMPGCWKCLGGRKRRQICRQIFSPELFRQETNCSSIALMWSCTFPSYCFFIRSQTVTKLRTDSDEGHVLINSTLRISRYNGVIMTRERSVERMDNVKDKTRAVVVRMRPVGWEVGRQLTQITKPKVIIRPPLFYSDPIFRAKEHDPL